jgi:hypothetical protein
MGADPAVVKNKAGSYVMIYTGPPNPTSLFSYDRNIENVKVYPSLCTNVVYVQSDGRDILNVDVIDITGRSVSLETIEATGKIDIGFLVPGIYMLRITGRQTSCVKKIVKAEE